MTDHELQKYAEYSVELLEANYPGNWTNDEATKLAKELISLEQEKWASEGDQAGRIVARAFVDEVNKLAAYGSNGTLPVGQETKADKLKAAGKGAQTQAQNLLKFVKQNKGKAGLIASAAGLTGLGMGAIIG